MDTKRFKLITYNYRHRNGNIVIFCLTLFEFKLFSLFLEKLGVNFNITFPGSQRRRKKWVRNYDQWPDKKEFLRLGYLQYYTIRLNVKYWKESFYNKFTNWLKENNYKLYKGNYSNCKFFQPSDIKEFYGEI